MGRLEPTSHKKNNKMKKTLLLVISFLLCCFLQSQNYKVKVGETLRITVPDVSLGYVDKAIWTCNNPAISFIEKSELSATIKVLTAFDGYAIIELVYVEKYVDYKGFTRANTYYTTYYISCIDGNSSNSQQYATGISVIPNLSVAIGEEGKITYQFVPAGSSAELHALASPGTHFNSLCFHPEGYLTGHARSVGEDQVILSFTNENNEEVEAICNITVYDPTWITPQAMALTPILLLSKKETFRLFPRLTPKNATTLYNWSSEDWQIASVNNGLITARNIGVTDIVVMTTNGLLKSCTIIVLDNLSEYPGIEAALGRAAKMLLVVEEEIIH